MESRNIITRDWVKINKVIISALGASSVYL